jgi:hypothetical protein
MVCVKTEKEITRELVESVHRKNIDAMIDEAKGV